MKFTDINMIILIMNINMILLTYIYSILPEYQNLMKIGSHFPYNMLTREGFSLLWQECIGYTSISTAWDIDVKSIFFIMSLRSLVARA